MSYQVLARKWRPRDFASLVGQEHVVRALKHGLDEGRLHHAYLFTGTRGVGKTTIARILAKALNCEAGVSAMPCGVCGACTEIDAGRFVDLLEVDAATNTRVDEMRQLLENAVYAPTRGRYKVYVIDEVHMLSNSAFNAMLKTLEEPPEHVKFILATTDPQKIPVTVLSRCLQFNLKQMPQAAIVGHLEHILQEEQVAFELAALHLVARSADGSMRDALSLLDQAIAHGAGKVQLNEVAAMLGAIGSDHVFSAINALIAGDADSLLQAANDFSERSLSFDAALQSLGEVWVRVQVAQFAPDALDGSDPDVARVRSLAEILDPEYVQMAYEITMQGRKNLPFAPDPLSGFVMTLLRLHAFFPQEAKKVAEKKSPRAITRDAHPVSPVTPPAGTSLAAAGKNAEPQASTVSSFAREGTPKEAIASGAAVYWPSLLEKMNLSGMVRELAQHCVLGKVEDACFDLVLSPAHRHLLTRVSQERLQQALTALLGSAQRLRIDIREVQTETLAAQTQRQRRQGHDNAVAAIEADQVVRDVIELMDASVIDASVKPASSNYSQSIQEVS